MGNKIITNPLEKQEKMPSAPLSAEEQEKLYRNNPETELGRKKRVEELNNIAKQLLELKEIIRACILTREERIKNQEDIDAELEKRFLEHKAYLKKLEEQSRNAELEKQQAILQQMKKHNEQFIQNLLNSIGQRIRYLENAIAQIDQRIQQLKALQQVQINHIVNYLKDRMRNMPSYTVGNQKFNMGEHLMSDLQGSLDDLQSGRTSLATFKDNVLPEVTKSAAAFKEKVHAAPGSRAAERIDEDAEKFAKDLVDKVENSEQAKIVQKADRVIEISENEKQKIKRELIMANQKLEDVVQKAGKKEKNVDEFVELRQVNQERIDLEADKNEIQQQGVNEQQPLDGLDDLNVEVGMDFEAIMQQAEQEAQEAKPQDENPQIQAGHP